MGEIPEDRWDGWTERIAGNAADSLFRNIEFENNKADIEALCKAIGIVPGPNTAVSFDLNNIYICQDILKGERPDWIRVMHRDS